ncbi:SOS response-associated peptidase [Pedobacter nototheniae]|uniref:SOS response-associated peptidase n=1 Tax=Pedobacter nototheniae TaxID=2488994 RepID=UPI00103CC1DF|nr:SOS response-associated peptidase [Pedobacter nototheniae]
MCYYVSHAVKLEDLKEYYSADPKYQEDVEEYNPYHIVSGFVHPTLSLITQSENRAIQKMQWGLIPNWKKPFPDMLKMSNNTLNAMSETLWEKPSFKNSIGKNRAILPVNGFYEYKHVDGDKLPYFIHPKSHPYFNLACIYSNYQNPDTKEWLTTFSIVTAEANELMADIHNSKKRMPLILDNDQIDSWINPSLAKPEIDNLLVGCDDRNMAAYRVDRNLIKLGNVQEAYKPLSGN